MVETQDPVGNLVTVGERDGHVAGNRALQANDYRVLQPSLLMDPNRNRTAVAFDALGLVVGTAIMGKPHPERVEGDSLTGFESDLPESIVFEHLANPLTNPQVILQHATRRLVYDPNAYYRTKDRPSPQPPVIYTLVRETHDTDLSLGKESKIQHSFSYSDGFGRNIQQKTQAEDGPLNTSDPRAPTTSPRWIGSGWVIFNNKGKPVRKYEPFFSSTSNFEFAPVVGVSPILFYDPLERVIATLYPNHTFDKVVFNPWEQITYDMNDTIIANGSETGDPLSDRDISELCETLS